MLVAVWPFAFFYIKPLNGVCLCILMCCFSTTETKARSWVYFQAVVTGNHITKHVRNEAYYVTVWVSVRN